MPRTRFDWLVITAVVAVLGAIWIGTTRVQADSAGLLGETPLPQAGHPAPDFTLNTLDGEALSLSDLRGQPVLVNFWATWCPPCRVEIPALEQVYRELGGEVVILGVDVQESASTVQAFVESNDMTYPVMLDTDATVARAYQVRAYPTTFFVDSRGVITHVFSGPLNEPLLYARLTEMLGQ